MATIIQPVRNLPNGTKIGGSEQIYSSIQPATRTDGTSLVQNDIWFDQSDYNSIYRWNNDAATWLPFINPMVGTKTFPLTLSTAAVTGSCTTSLQANYRRLTISSGATGTGRIFFGNLATTRATVGGRSVLLDFGRRITHVNRLSLRIFPGVTYYWYVSLTEANVGDLNQKGYGFKIVPSANIYLQIHDGTNLYTSPSLGVLEPNGQYFYPPDFMINWDGVSKVSLWYVHPWYNTLTYLGSLTAPLSGAVTSGGSVTFSVDAAPAGGAVFVDYCNYYCVGG